VDRSFEKYADHHVGTHLQTAKVMREFVGARVQLAVGNSIVTENQRDI
jgi:hypothetical protein